MNQAEIWYRRAAQHNDADAMYNLGVLLQQRGGTDASAEAETWYRRAAQHDHPDAMVGLGLLVGGRKGADTLAEAEPRHLRAPEHVHPERRRRSHRAALTLALLGTAAAAIFASILLVRPSPDCESVQFALTATELAPGAEGTAEVTPEESGLRIELNATGLPRRDNGSFYQAWLRNDDGQSIAIGTFHDGDDVTLWAGVSLKDYPELTVTQETADNNQASSRGEGSGRLGLLRVAVTPPSRPIRIQPGESPTSRHPGCGGGSGMLPNVGPVVARIGCHQLGRDARDGRTMTRPKAIASTPRDPLECPVRSLPP